MTDDIITNMRVTAGSQDNGKLTCKCDLGSIISTNPRMPGGGGGGGASRPPIYTFSVLIL